MSLSLNSLSTSPRSRKTKQKRTTRGDGDKKQAVECSALHVHGGVGWAAEGKERRAKEEEAEESALSARGRRFFSSQPLPFPSKKKKNQTRLAPRAGPRLGRDAPGRPGHGQDARDDPSGGSSGGRRNSRRRRRKRRRRRENPEEEEGKRLEEDQKAKTEPRPRPRLPLRRGRDGLHPLPAASGRLRLGNCPGLLPSGRLFLRFEELELFGFFEFEIVVARLQV